ncbi:hypothetical protein DL767_006919 [Monosporascus sp. MG133]|nr:hypothetical protein DL767_006919 [Monosporascus sp. MG133]
MLYITGQFPNTIYQSLLERIRDVGKIYHIRIGRVPARGNRSLAALVVLWDLTVTRRLVLQTDDTLLDEDSFKAEVEVLPRWFQMPVPTITSQSRVIHITGNHHIVNEDFILRLLCETFQFDLDRAVEIVLGGEASRLEVYFANYAYQAEWAYHKLTTDPHVAGRFTTVFAPDPCDIVKGDS